MDPIAFYTYLNNVIFPFRQNLAFSFDLCLISVFLQNFEILHDTLNKRLFEIYTQSYKH